MLKNILVFIETAEDYVSKIYDAVLENIKSSTYKESPKTLKYLGSNYIFYKI